MAAMRSLPIRLGKVTDAQISFSTKNRLSDEFRKEYGQYVLTDAAYKSEIARAIRQIKKYGGYDTFDLDREKDRDLLADFLYSKNILQYQAYEYFVYRFRDKPVSERLTFIQGRFQTRYHELLNNKEGFDLLRDKYRTYLTLKEYYRRDVVFIQNEENLGEFEAFLNSNERFIIKPLNANSGTGVRIVDRPDTAEGRLSLIRNCSPFIAEELILPCDEFKSIYPNAVNTVRFYTFLCGDGTVKPFMSFLRAGQGNMIVDNMGAGGMMCLVDAPTGLIYTNAVDEECREYVTHPDTGFKFSGYQLPDWPALLDITRKIGAMVPGARFIGWDCTYSRNKGWQIVGGYGYGTLSLMQMPIHMGLKETVETFFLENY